MCALGESSEYELFAVGVMMPKVGADVIDGKALGTLSLESTKQGHVWLWKTASLDVSTLASCLAATQCDECLCERSQCWDHVRGDANHARAI